MYHEAKKKKKKLPVLIPSFLGGRKRNTATGHGLDGRGIGVPSPGRVQNFLHFVQTVPGTQAFYPMVTGGSFPGGKAAGA
jgi:hypothetical protein